MRPVPSRLLPHVVTVRPFLGDSGDGYLYGPAVQVRARVDARPKLVVGVDGQQATANATLVLPPGAPVALLARITLPDGTQPRILAVRTHHDARRPIYIEVDVA